MVFILVTMRLIMMLFFNMTIVPWVVSKSTLDKWMEHREFLMHELGCWKFFHKDWVMDEHCCVAFDKGFEDTIFIWEKSNICVNNMISLLLVKHTVYAQIVVNSLDDLTFGLSIFLLIFDLRKRLFCIYRLLDVLVTKMSLCKLLLESMSHRFRICHY